MKELRGVGRGDVYRIERKGGGDTGVGIEVKANLGEVADLGRGEFADFVSAFLGLSTM